MAEKGPNDAPATDPGGVLLKQPGLGSDPKTVGWANCISTVEAVGPEWHEDFVVLVRRLLPAPGTARYDPLKLTQAEPDPEYAEQGRSRVDFYRTQVVPNLILGDQIQIRVVRWSTRPASHTHPRDSGLVTSYASDEGSFFRFVGTDPTVYLLRRHPRTMRLTGFQQSRNTMTAHDWYVEASQIYPDGFLDLYGTLKVYSLPFDSLTLSPPDLPDLPG